MIKKWIISEFLHNSRLQYSIGIGALIFSCMFQTILPKQLGSIMDLLSKKEAAQSDVAVQVLLMIAIGIILSGLKFVWRYLIQGKARDLDCFLRAKLFAHLQTLPVSFYHNKKTGDLMAYAINDLSALKYAFSFGIVFLIDGILINTFAVMMMFRTINIPLTLLAIAPVLIASVMVVWIRPKIRSRFTRVQEAFADISDKVQENISGIRVVKGYVQEEKEVERLNSSSLERAEAQMSYVRLSSLLTPFINICFGASFAFAIIFGSRFVTSGAISLGDYIAFNTYLVMLQTPVNHLGKIVETWQKAMASVRRLDEIFLTKNDILDENPTFEGDRFSRDLVVKDLSFSYPGCSREALSNINFKLEAGQTLAVIGDTGSGKSTLVNLLLRLYNVERGQILIDGTDINDIPVDLLRRNIGTVPQENFLFSTTIKENIRTFMDQYTDCDVEKAACMADVHGNISDFPDKYETVIGERGITLSGGQRQRVSIARALIRLPDILILDDSLSAVDTKTEETILGNLKNLLKNKTGIIISHRISTIKHADEIIVLDKGRIIEKGTHEMLLAGKGKYCSLYESQISNQNPEVGDEISVG